MRKARSGGIIIVSLLVGLAAYSDREDGELSPSSFQNGNSSCTGSRGAGRLGARFVRPPIGKPLADDAFEQLGRARHVINAKTTTIAVAKIELCKVAMQMS